MSHVKRDLAKYTLSLIRNLPRVALNNVQYIPGTHKKKKSRRGQHGGNYRGATQNGPMFVPIGWEGTQTPFYLKFPREQYYHKQKYKRSYPPLSLGQLQLMIDLNRLDITKPIDLTTLCNTDLYQFNPKERDFGVNLTEEGADIFKAKINIEVQWTSEAAIAAIEKNGGVITSAYYDTRSLHILQNVKKFFETGDAIPRRMIPPDDAILFYTSAASRGYLADPEEISAERLVLAQKYGYELPHIEDDPAYEMLTERKDPRQIFYGLEPGWVVSLRDKTIMKPKEEHLEEFFKS